MHAEIILTYKPQEYELEDSEAEVQVIPVEVTCATELTNLAYSYMKQNNALMVNFNYLEDK